MHNKNGQGKTFYFKQFQINHDRCAMKVGTDGVLVGAWCNVRNAKRVLDIGSGSGLIALMVAQRTDRDVFIDGVEVDINSFEQATENIKNSPWSDRLQMHHSTIQNFKASPLYDLIVCNPPYFENSLLPLNTSRNISRHTTALSFGELILSVKRLLTPEGKFNVILPYTEGTTFIHTAAKHGLFCCRRTAVQSKAQRPVERLLLEFSFQSINREENNLMLEASSGIRTVEYRQLVDQFYL